MNGSTTQLQIAINAVDNASAVLKDLASNADSALGDFSAGAQQAKNSNDDLSKSVFDGIASWDLLKEGAMKTFDFLKEAVLAAAQSSGEMAIVRTNIENAGMSFDEIGPKLKAYSESMMKMGYDNEATSSSVAKLLLVTHDYDQALALNQLAMDLSANKHISLEQATTSLAQVLQGAGARALMQYGITFKDGATSAQVLVELQQKVAGSAQAMADSSQGSLNDMNIQWEEFKKTLGEIVLPILGLITKGFNEIATAVGWVITPLKNLVSAHSEVTEAQQKNVEKGQQVVDAYNKMHAGAQVTLADFNGLTKSSALYVEAEKDFKMQTDASTKALENVANGSSKATSALVKHSDAVTKVGDEYQKLKDDGSAAVEKLSDAFEKSLAGINDKIAKTNETIATLTASYNQSQADATTSVAEQIVAAQQKVADIKAKLAAATSATEQANLQQQLATEQANLASSAAFQTANAAAIDAAKTRASMTDLQRTISDYNSKKAIAEKDYQEKLLKLQKELADEQKQKADLVVLETDKQVKIKALMDKAQTEFTKLSNDRRDQTTKEVDAEIKEYQALAAAIAKTQTATMSQVGMGGGGSSIAGIPKLAAGGIVSSPTIALIGEAGPEMVIPMSQMGGVNPSAATASGGSSSAGGGGTAIVVNMNGTFGNGKEGVREIANQIANTIQQQLRLKRIA